MKNFSIRDNGYDEQVNVEPDTGFSTSCDRFGASAPSDVLMREYAITVENVCMRALAMLR